ncbi:MAG: VWA domain-containing protein, partial [Eudoraea sp.]|uniref:VWA domain-containing protein n=1 Tax=Eudoraea sp. TaxID=1979955 RepID=UPI003C74A3E9
NTALLVLTDGNQNIGEDYEFYAGLQQNSIYPIVIGDTTRHDDLSIDQVNTNKFAFLKNQFPIEIFISYSGNPNITTELRIVENGKVVFKEKLTLSKNQNSIIKNVLLEASDVGIQNLNVQLTPLKNEKNITNNNRQVVLEVIDEKTEIAIVSEILHPDLGALKKSIETNEQRKVSLVNPSDDVSSLDSFDLLILYQPEESFTEIYELISNKGLNYFTITGSQTDWSFLNAIQNSYQMNSFDQNEEVFPILNGGFTKFDIKEFEVEDLPPLQTVLGELLITTSFENILEQKIKGIPLNEPLFAILETNENREAVLYGEDIWKWRMQVFKEDKSFKRFDDLMAKVILYLTDSNPRTRLNLDYQTVYEGSGKASIKATYFDETYIFDPKASLKVRVTNSETTDSNELPMLLKNDNYQTDLSSLLPGNYNFEVLVETKGIAEKGKFSILDYDLEKQFLSSNYKKLDRAAITSGGQLFYPDQLPEIISDLIQDNRYLPIQKSNENIVSLIDFKILLAVMAFALAMEWFLRKYYGLI